MHVGRMVVRRARLFRLFYQYAARCIIFRAQHNRVPRGYGVDALFPVKGAPFRLLFALVTHISQRARIELMRMRWPPKGDQGERKRWIALRERPRHGARRIVPSERVANGTPLRELDRRAWSTCEPWRPCPDTRRGIPRAARFICTVRGSWRRACIPGSPRP